MEKGQPGKKEPVESLIPTVGSDRSGRSPAGGILFAVFRAFSPDTEAV